ncbi:MAG: hypothetical protein M3P27_06895 [Acidobacteriota bacterium]|nr:hypothetical protein [Acidobacteriota bacterium]
MNPSVNKRTTSLILWSVFWAVLLISAAFLLKGNPARNWVESVIFTVAMASLILMGLLSNRRNACEQNAGGPQDAPK